MIRTSILPHTSTKRFACFGVVLFVSFLPLVLLAQQAPATQTTQAAQPSVPPHPADMILQQEGYVAPPEEIVSAVLAPRYLNATLSNLSPDKKWYLNEIGDGPVPMSVFSKPVSYTHLTLPTILLV